MTERSSPPSSRDAGTDGWTATSDSLELPGATVERGIRRRFVVAISALVALVLTAQGAVLVLFGHGYLEDQIEQEAESFATLAAAPICDAFRKYFESGYTKFRDLVNQTVELEPDLERMAIFDTEGKQLFLLDDLLDGPEEPEGLLKQGRLTEGDPLLAAVRGLETVTWEARVNGHRHYVVVEPYVEEWGRHQYSVVFWVSYDSVRSAMVDIGWRVLGLALVSLVLGIGCAWVLSAQSLRPVERLTAAARRLAKGDLDHRVDLHSGDEFEILGATMDHMAALLSRTIVDMETTNRHLELLNKELQELDKVKSDLLANVSHELRTPLTAIRGYVEAMSSGLLGDVNEVQSESLEVVERNIARLRNMIDQLLSYSRMESGRLEVDLRAFDLESTARHVLEAVAAARNAEDRLKLRSDPDLPEVFGDAGRIAQVLENLLTNAIKFSPENSEVELVLEATADGVSVEVRDHGIGVPRDEQDKIFGRFYQIDSGSTRQFGGMGLGLAIVRDILELHHSKIELDSAPDEGSTFRFVLPLASERTALVPVGRGWRLVVIDDDAQFVQKVTAQLHHKSWSVQAAATASQGISLVRQAKPDVIVLDRLLPDRDGFDLLAELRADERHSSVPVVLCTVRRERALGLRLGAADYWVKPLSPEDFHKRLMSVVTQRGHRADAADGKVEGEIEAEEDADRDESSDDEATET